MVSWSSIWNADLQGVVCEVCDSAFLVPTEITPQTCPHCFQDELDPLEPESENMAYTQSPELVLRFAISKDDALKRIMQFTEVIPTKPEDLTEENIRKRLRPVYFPMWLVDANVSGHWQAEAGYHYQVVSHEESFSGGDWRTVEVKKTRTNWEKRLGTFDRHYDNVAAPALEWHAKLIYRTGDYDPVKAEAYGADSLSGIFVQLPNRSTDDAWGDARNHVREIVSDECRQASEADEIEKFGWTPEFTGENWTLSMMPVFTCYYLDDDGVPQLLYVNGQTGKAGGALRASPKRAQRWIWLGLGLSFFVFVGTLIIALLSLAFPPALVLAALLLFVSVSMAGGGFVPSWKAKSFNKRNFYKDIWKT